jgi:hypothetical protein
MRFVRGNRTLAQAIEDVKDRTWDTRVALLEPDPNRFDGFATNVVTETSEV